VRWGVFSDIHGSLWALHAVLDELDRFGAERYAYLGDLVGYGPHPDEVVATVAELGPLIVAGNHDLAVAGRLRMDWFAPVPRTCLEWTVRTVRPATLQYLRALPRTADLGGIRLVHALPPDSATTYLTAAALPELAVAAGRWPESLCFCGHTHRPQCVALPPRVGPPGESEEAAGAEDAAPDGATTQDVSLVLQPLPARWWASPAPYRAVVNLGSVGQPRDGDPRAFCALWDDDRLTLESRRVAYDIEQTIADMKAAGLPAEPARRLRDGT
jgi:diadenosine tetraphosphatase ApaH/serine/threonine PP2A family protein phosphatase